MHGIIRPISASPAPSAAAIRLRALRERLHAWRGLLLIVVLPTALVAAYLFLMAADQYESEADFTVSVGGSTSISPGGFGELVGIGVTSQSQNAANSVTEYLRSHDVIAELRPRLDLVGMFRRPEADLLGRLRDASPSPERLLRYFRSKVAVRYDRDTGLTTMQVRAFRPDDAYVLARAMLELGERRVNAMNARSYADAVAAADRLLHDAERGVAITQTRMTAFRQSQRDINPQSSGEAQLRLVSDLRGNLAAARAQLGNMAGAIAPSSPQYVALSRQVRALGRQLGVEAGRLAGSGSAIAASVGDYESLQVRQQFAVKRYDAAAAAADKAREDARRQQLYLVRVVDANRPVESLYPRRWRIVATTFVALLLAYSIGWLIAAGVREHAA